jgi:NO-binding membrane sensor protein with MHYT domain
MMQESATKFRLMHFYGMETMCFSLRMLIACTNTLIKKKTVMRVVTESGVSCSNDTV